MLRLRFLAALATLLAATHASAALVMTVDLYTTDELTITLSGTFDADTVGDFAGFLAIKNDWSNNVGVHTELFSGPAFLALNTVTIGGVPAGGFVDATGDPAADTVVIQNPDGIFNPILAGTPVAGVISLFGVGMFDPSDLATLELVSGLNSISTGDFARLEANAVAVPEPSSIGTVGLGLAWLGLRGTRRRRAANAPRTR